MHCRGDLAVDAEVVRGVTVDIIIRREDERSRVVVVGVDRPVIALDQNGVVCVRKEGVRKVRVEDLEDGGRIEIVPHNLSMIDDIFLYFFFMNDPTRGEALQYS